MDPNRNMLWGRVVAEELVRSGVRFVCIAPGSRSGPLAIALAEAEGLRVSVHLDERSCAFYALGIGRSTGKPAAILCTSGTAAANFLPAVVEAFQAQVPLIVLTADRPPELRACSAAQTIDQARLFGSHALEFVELPTPEPQPAVLRALRATVCRLVDRAMGPPAGPVHLNIPMRDPLDLRAIPGDLPADLEQRDPVAFRGHPEHPFVRSHRSRPAGGGAAADRLAEAIAAHPDGVIVAGPMPQQPGLVQSVLELAQRSGYPILADCLSPLRTAAPEGGPVLATYDAVLRSPLFAEAHRPDLVLRLGAPPTSKTLNLFLASSPQMLVEPQPGTAADPWHSGAEVLRADPTQVCADAAKLLPSAGPSKLAAAYTEADRLARHALTTATPGEWYERDLVEAMARLLPAEALLFAGSSMPIRELDSFYPVQDRRVRILSNRGANGIDGVVSTALGAMSGTGGPGALLIGDVTLLHDMGGLMAARREGLPLVTVVIHNDGGAIFSYLPVAQNSRNFEALFSTPHGLDLEPLAKFHKIPFYSAQGPEFAECFGAALAAGVPSLIEVRLERERSVRLHRMAWQAAARAVEE